MCCVFGISKYTEATVHATVHPSNGHPWQPGWGRPRQLQPLIMNIISRILKSTTQTWYPWQPGWGKAMLQPQTMNIISRIPTTTTINTTLGNHHRLFCGWWGGCKFHSALLVLTIHQLRLMLFSSHQLVHLHHLACVQIAQVVVVVCGGGSCVCGGNGWMVVYT